MKLVTAIVLMGITASAAAKMESSEDKYRYKGDTEFSGFCKAIVDDNLVLLKRSAQAKVGSFGKNNLDVIRKIAAANGMKCNGSDLLAFAKERKADEIYAYLNKKL